MANCMIPSQERLVHKQQFQNARQIVEVVIKTKPKPKASYKTKAPLFLRDCALKKELENLEKTDQVKLIKNKKGLSKEKKTMKAPVTNVEIYKKSKKGHIKNHDVLPPNMSWGELLESCSSLSLVESDISGSDHNKPTSSSSNRSTGSEVGLREVNRAENHRKRNRRKNDVPLVTNLPKFDFANNNQFSQGIDRSIQTTLIEDINHISTLNRKNVNESSERHHHPIPTGANTSKESLLSEKMTRRTDPNFGSEPLNGNKENIPKEPLKTTEETHSPFGESALRLLHHLRERLRSRGDSEGSDIVNAIEAYFSGQGSLGGNKGTFRQGLNAGSEFTSTPSYVPVFPTPNPRTVHLNYGNAEQNNRIISEQSKKLKEQEETIQELRSLSARLLAHHEQLTNQILREPEYKKDTNCDEQSSKTHTKSADSGIDLSASEKDFQKVIKQLTSERDALLKEVKTQREIILNLEVKLDKSSKELERRPLTVLSNRAESSQSETENDARFLPIKTGNHVLPSNRHHQPFPQLTVNGKILPTSTRKLNSDTESDSAYEEKCSRSTSKISSAYCGSIQNQHVDNDNLHDYGKPNQKFQPAGELLEVPRKTLSKQDLAESSEKMRPYEQDFLNLPGGVVNRMAKPNNSNGIDDFSSYRIRTPDESGELVHKDVSLSFISEVSEEEQARSIHNQSLLISKSYESTQHNFAQNMDGKQNLKCLSLVEENVSNSPIVLHPEKYFESTHVPFSKSNANEGNMENSSSDNSEQERILQPPVTLLDSEISNGDN